MDQESVIDHGAIMKRARVAQALAFLILAPTAPLSAESSPILERYGRIGVYQVVRTANNACLATRSIRHELRDGGSADATFAFGFGVIHGRLLSLASILSPAYDMPRSSWQKGHLRIDGVDHRVAFVADDRSLLSAYGPPRAMMAFFEGREITFRLPTMTETIPLDG
ncbi:MAG TPA: hypothetical protein VLA37_10435, partial [Sphingomonadaceae bacterium]|nr:hypothetical protein [Sphingomonadaceae bacterium]